MIQTDLFEAPVQTELKDTVGFYLPGANRPGAFTLPPQLAALYELSVNAFYAAIHAEMSELPIKKEISRFVEKVLNAGGKTISGKLADDRAAAEQAASDRGDPDVMTVLKAAGRVQHEIHRITGFLRFRAEPEFSSEPASGPAADGVYTAHCSPDYFILPALARHFTLRFGETPWAIIDEKRKLCLYRKAGGQAMLIRAEEAGAVPAALAGGKDRKDFWEDLWRLYHRSINNESRKNPGIQRQFMPERYRKYLSELK